MGYDGYEEYLCANGHYDAVDAYESRPDVCEFCKASIAWVRQVDTTNGVDMSYPGSLPEPLTVVTQAVYSDPVKVIEAIVERCNGYNLTKDEIAKFASQLSSRLISPTVFKIPDQSK